jgi:hypothetical protein
MNETTSNFLKMGAVGAALTVSIGFAVSRGGALWKSGEIQAGAWFYDLSEKKLYKAARENRPPHQGIGGKKGDGVRAVVVSWDANSTKNGEKRIAYLEMYTPELKKMLEEVQAARATGKPLAPPTQDSDFFQSNTLVKRVEDAQWQPLNTPEGAQITTEWRAWRGKNGESPMVAMP